MKRKDAGKVTLESIGSTLGEFRTSFRGVDSTLGEFRTTLSELGEMLGFVVEHMATKDDVAELRKEFKSDLFTLQTQVNGIESDIRDMKRARLEIRVGDLEEKVFGEARQR